MNTQSLEKLYAKFTPVADVDPANMQREIGHFNVFNLDAIKPSSSHQSPMTYGRRTFYKISLNRGRSRVEYADQIIDVGQNTLFLATPRVSYRWLPVDTPLEGYFCVFTDEFLLPAKGVVVLDELPIFHPNAYPVLEVTNAQFAAAEAIFEKMAQEIKSDYTYKYNLLRTYLVELLHLVQKLQPNSTRLLAHSASTRIAARFAELLEEQFPVDAPPLLRLRTAKDYAEQLAVHVNHLNRVLKEATGQTTTALIGNRMAQEAKLLLKQPFGSVAEIADQLGFTDVAHFCTFFKRQTGLTPSDFRE